MRFSKREFKDKQLELDLFLQTTFPQLEYTGYYVPDYHKDTSNNHTGANHDLPEMKNAGNHTPLHKPLKKETLIELIRYALTTSEKKEKFDEILRKYGYTLYRRGKTFGVINPKGQKHRFKTL